MIQIKDRVRLNSAKPLPSGATVRLVALVDWINADGTFNVRICTPGLYCGGIFRNLNDADVEAVRT